MIRGPPNPLSILQRLFNTGVRRSWPMFILCILDLAIFTLVALCFFLLVIILTHIYGHAQILYYGIFAIPMPAAWMAVFLSTIAFGSGSIIRIAVVGNLSAILMMAFGMLGSVYFYIFEMPNFVDCVRDADNLLGAGHIICVDQIVGAWFLMVGVAAILPLTYLISGAVRTVDTILILVKSNSVPAPQVRGLLSAQEALFSLPGWGK